MNKIFIVNRLFMMFFNIKIKEVFFKKNTKQDQFVKISVFFTVHKI